MKTTRTTAKSASPALRMVVATLLLAMMTTQSLAFPSASAAAAHLKPRGGSSSSGWPMKTSTVTSTHRAAAADSARGGGAVVQNNMLGQYSQFVDEKPFIAKGTTAGVISVLADLFAQLVIKHQSVVDWRRLVAFFLTGYVFVGPYLHVFYGQLNRIAPGQTKTVRTIVKMLVDQTIGVCIFFPLYFTAFEVAESLVMGRVPNVGLALDKCRAGIKTIVFMNWRIWPLANIINFGLVPPQLQVLVNQVISFFWFAYLSTRIS